PARRDLGGIAAQHGLGATPYFSLKDGQARIDAVVWKGVFGRLRLRGEISGVSRPSTGSGPRPTSP
ncbi:hypothetical protein CTI14_69765, partial [Methylobacterium radiotolerans]